MAGRAVCLVSPWLQRPIRSMRPQQASEGRQLILACKELGHKAQFASCLPRLLKKNAVILLTDLIPSCKAQVCLCSVCLGDFKSLGSCSRTWASAGHPQVPQAPLLLCIPSARRCHTNTLCACVHCSNICWQPARGGLRQRFSSFSLLTPSFSRCIY